MGIAFSFLLAQSEPAHWRLVPPFYQLYGWGILIVAGAGSYYFAKKSIDERRRTQERAGSRPKEQLTCELLLRHRQRAKHEHTSID